MSGIFDWLNGQPDYISQGGPYPAVTRLGLIGAGLQDMQSAINGQPGGAMNALYARAQANRQASDADSGGGMILPSATGTRPLRRRYASPAAMGRMAHRAL